MVLFSTLEDFWSLLVHGVVSVPLLRTSERVVDVAPIRWIVLLSFKLI